MCYISILEITSLKNTIIKKNHHKCRIKTTLEEENPFQLNKQKTISFGNNKTKFIITLILHFLKIRKTKILSMNTQFSCNKFPTNWESNGKYKLINYTNHMQQAGKYLWICFKYGFTITLLQISMRTKETFSSLSINLMSRTSTKGWNMTLRESLDRLVSKFKMCQ